MKTFYNILHKCCSITPSLNKTFITDERIYDSSYIFNKNFYEMKNNPNTLNVILCQSYIQSNFFSTIPITDKFIYIKKIIENPFISNKQREEFLEKFGKAQQLYKRLCRLVHQWKWRRMEISIDNDLLLNPINENQYFTIAIAQFGKKYLFTKRNTKN